jgi:fumarate hydratase class I
MVESFAVLHSLAAVTAAMVFRPASRLRPQQFLTNLAMRRHAAAAAAAPGPQFAYEELFQAASPKQVPWRKLSDEGVTTLEVHGKRVLQVSQEALRLLASEAMSDIAHLLRPGHLQQLANILKDKEACLCGLRGVSARPT